MKNLKTFSREGVLYQAPTVDRLSVNIEKGFAASGMNTPNNWGGSFE